MYKLLTSAGVGEVLSNALALMVKIMTVEMKVILRN